MPRVVALLLALLRQAPAARVLRAADLALAADSRVGNATLGGELAAAQASGAPPCACEPSNSSWTTCSRNVSQCVFIDLGAASGNTFHAFLDDKYGPLAGCANGWRAILVEANPRFDPQLKQIKAAFPGLVEADTSTAAYACEGVTSFYLDTVNHAQDYWGSSMAPTHPDVQKSGHQRVTVPTLNLNRILMEHTTPADWVIVKMDIEGAEWDVLPCLARSPAAGLVDRLFLEEHSQTWGLSGTSRQELDTAKATLKSRGVDIPPYFSQTLF